MNHIILRGRLTDTPEIRVATGEDQPSVARFTLAVPDRVRKNEDGEYETDFIKMVAYNTIAKNVEKYTEKGSEILAEGKLHTYSYKNKEGKTTYMAEVILEKMEFLSGTKKDSDLQKKPSSTKKSYVRKN